MTDRATVSVLLIEDDASMARLVRHLLELDGYTRIRHVWTAEQAVTAALDADIILLDHQLPDIRGIELLPQLLGRPDPPSVVMVTGHGSESLAAAALRQGAEDYLTKDHTLPELLPRILERVRRNRALRTALADAERELVQAERLAAIGEMSVTLHHELNNPLMAAMAETELMLSDQTLPAQHRAGAEVIRSALTRMAERLRQAAELRQADSIDYLKGIRMIDLNSTEPCEISYRGKALIYHSDQRIRRVLSLLLRHAGFLVERVSSIVDLQQGAVQPGVTLVLVPQGTEAGPALSGFIPAPERTYALATLGADWELRSRNAGADHIVALPFDPATIATDLISVAQEGRKAPKGVEERSLKASR